jgi:hypothetical protein
VKKHILLIIISILLTTGVVHATPMTSGVFDYFGGIAPENVYLFIDGNGDHTWDWIITPTGNWTSVLIPFKDYPGLNFIEINLWNLTYYIGWTFACPKEIQKVDEPATLFLMGSGLFVVGLLLRKKIIKPLNR